jgi:hypothetical protein
MGLLNNFVSNVFDIYPSEKFLEQFLDGKSLDLSKIFKYNFLKLSLVYSYIWNIIYKTYPTKRDFINYVNLIKIIPEACNITYDGPFLEKLLNTFLHVKIGMIKNMDMLGILNDLKIYVADLDEPKFLHEQLIKKWQYRYYNTFTKSPSSNILLDFASLHNAYVAPNIYKYQINPISNSYNENVLFGDDDNTYLNENEKIQYTIYKDNHFFIKIIDNIGVLFDNEINFSRQFLEEWINTLHCVDKFVNLLNCPIADINDSDHTFTIDKRIIHMFPSTFSKFIYVSNTAYPTQKSLAINKDNGIYYLFTDKPTSNTEDTVISKSYDRYIINSYNNLNINSSVKKYIILNPPIQKNKEIDIVCGPKTYEVYKEKLENSGFTFTNDANNYNATKYVIDMYQELDILDFMSNGTIPIIDVNTPNLFVKHLITGYKTSNPMEIITVKDNVITNNIKKNLKYIGILNDKKVFQYMWKQHLELTCPSRTINYKNGLLIYLNFIYSYFVKQLEKIIAIEDKGSKGNEYKVVLVDNRDNPLSIFSILFTLSNLNIMWSCKVYTSKKAYLYYNDIIGDIADVVCYPDLDVKKFHIDIYNKLLKSADFWKSIGSTKTLLIQDDGVLIRQSIDKFLKFDYIGASWVDSSANEYIKNNISEDLVGNGGISLRTNSLMIEICEKYVKEKTWLFYKNMTQIPEDVYFVYCSKRTAGTVMPSYQEGTEFASEEICNFNSIAIHKCWSYHISDVIEKFFDNIIKN